MRVSEEPQAVRLTLTALLLLFAIPAQALLVDGGDAPATRALALEELDYEVAIAGPYARTEIAAVLRNPGTQGASHTFAFTVPQRAMISNFSLAVGGVTYYAEVLEKQTAQGRYNAAVDEGRTAGLVASLGDHLFTYAVSLTPGETVRLALRYEQVLLKANGHYRYELGLTADTHPLSARTMTFHADVFSMAPIGEVLTTGYDKSMITTRTGPTALCVQMGASGFEPTEDIAIEWATGPGPLAGEMLFGQHRGMGYFVHIFGPGPTEVFGVALPKDFVFVVDRSGSMDGRKLDQSKEALGLIYSSLKADDRFSLVKFDDSFETFSPSLVSASPAEIARLHGYIAGIYSGGSTDIHSAVMAALDIFKAAEEPVPIIVLLSDGQANTGLYARSDFRRDVLAKNTVDASIYCIALGSDADWAFLEALALENHGSAVWVGPEEYATDAIAEFVGAFSAPVLSGVSFDYGAGAVDVLPGSVRAHYAGSEVLVAGRFPLGVERIEVEMRSRGSEGTVGSDGVFDVPDELKDGYVPRMWALHRIQALEDQMKWNGTDDATVKEVIDLAMEFHLATDRTSLLVELPEGLEDRFGVPALSVATDDWGADMDGAWIAHMCTSSFTYGGSTNGNIVTDSGSDSLSGGPPYQAPPDAEGSAVALAYGAGAPLLDSAIVLTIAAVAIAAVAVAAKGRSARRRGRE